MLRVWLGHLTGIPAMFALLRTSTPNSTYIPSVLSNRLYPCPHVLLQLDFISGRLDMIFSVEREGPLVTPKGPLARIQISCAASTGG